MARKKTKKLTKKQKQRKTARKKFLRSLKFKLIKYAFYAFLVFAAYLFLCWLTLPNLEKAIYRDRLPATTILATNGNEIHTFGTVYSEVIYLKDLPDYVPQAIIATEDRRFYTHFGFDLIAFVRAMTRNIAAGRFKEGGSTITQQVAKNLFLNSRKDITRKVQELMMAFWLENKLTKEQILTLYLNRVYMGAGTYGIEAASQKYFSKSSRDLNLKEAAILAGLLKAPSRYNPIASLERAEARAQTVLKNMVLNNYISKDDAIMAAKMKLGADKSYKLEGGRHFADFAHTQTNQILGERDTDVYVLTTIDQPLQEAAEKILHDALKANSHRNITEGAIIVLAPDGAIKALAGGANYNTSQFNRAVQSLRQPGSSFKPIVFATALENGFSTMDIIEDKPITIKKWKPENYDKKHYGNVTLMHALTKSLNLAAIDLTLKTGGPKIIKTAKEMGISTPITNSPSLALGAFEVKVIDLITAYAVIQNDGRSVEPFAVKEIYTKDGFQQYMHEPKPSTQILNPKTTFQLKEMLKNVIDNGTGLRARLPFPAYGKTGTTQDYRDAWFVGFSDQYITAVWLGNDNNTPMQKVTGGGLPAEIWKKVMLKAHNR